MFTKLISSFVLETEHIQEMDDLANVKPDYIVTDAIDAAPALVAQFSSDEDEAEEDEVDISLS